MSWFVPAILFSVSPMFFSLFAWSICGFGWRILNFSLLFSYFKWDGFISSVLMGYISKSKEMLSFLTTIGGIFVNAFFSVLLFHFLVTTIIYSHSHFWMTITFMVLSYPFPFDPILCYFYLFCVFFEGDKYIWFSFLSFIFELFYGVYTFDTSMSKGKCFMVRFSFKKILPGKEEDQIQNACNSL